MDTEQPGFVENVWVGRVVSIEDGPRLRISMPDPRCVMPTLAQGDASRTWPGRMRTLIEEQPARSLEPGARFPCAGVYAVVEVAGLVREGAAVSVA